MATNSTTSDAGYPTIADVAPESISARALIVHYWHAAVRRRWLILAIIVACLVVGAIKTMLQPPVYTAVSEIQISRAKKNVTNVSSVDTTTNESYDSEFYETQYALLKTSSQAQRVARKLDLANSPDFFAAQGIRDDKLTSSSRALDPATRKSREALAAAMLQGGISVSPIRNSSLVNIGYSSRSAIWSARIANAWPREYIAANMEREYTSNADARRFLESMLNDLRRKVEQSESNLLTFAADHSMVKLGGSRDATGRTTEARTLVETDLEALNSALLTARSERIATEAGVDTRVGQGGAQGPSSAATLQQKRDELTAEYAQMLVKFDPRYPAARALKAQIDALDSAVSRESAREAGRTSSSRRDQISGAQRREAQLASQVQGLKSKLDRQQHDNIQYSIFQREADTNRQLYDAMLQRYKEVGLAGSVGSSNISMVQEASVPGGPSNPTLLRNLALALVIGFALSALTVFALEQVDERLRDPSDIERLLGLPLLGSAPLVKGDPLEELKQNASEISEAYFSLATVIAFSTTHGLPRSFLITSSEPGEGKSTTSLALATTIARTSKRVLLIDGDLRSPSLHSQLSVSNDAGFSNLLAGDDDLTAHVRTTETAGLSILTSGPRPPSAAELLGSDRLKLVLERLNQYYDCVVIDGPPVIGIADAPLLAKAVEGCIVVVEAESTGLKSVRNSIRRLLAVDSRIFGVVVTKFSADRYGYDYGYGKLEGGTEAPLAA